VRWPPWIGQSKAARKNAEGERQRKQGEGRERAEGSGWWHKKRGQTVGVSEEGRGARDNRAKERVKGETQNRPC
jgi:hypothetical protein